MPSINMIAARRAEKLKLEKNVRVMFLVVVGELAVTLALLSFMTAQVYGANRSISDFDQKLKKIQPTVEKIKYYNSEITNLQPRLSLLADTREQTLTWYNIMQELGHSMPERTWLNGISATQASASQSTDAEGKEISGAKLSLRGVSANQRLVGETMLKLNRFPEIDKVDLNFTQKGGDATLETVEFDMAATLKSDKPEEGGTTNAKN